MTASTKANLGPVGPSRPARRTPLWARILLVLAILVVIAAAAVGGVAVGKFFGAQESRDTQVIRSIKGDEQVILLTAGMTDVKEEKADGLKLAIGDLQLFTLPGTERSLLVRYEYDAKFGIEGQDVDIQSTGNDSYLVTIPKFMYLGYGNPDLSVAGEKNGALSWTTPEIDKRSLRADPHGPGRERAHRRVPSRSRGTNEDVLYPHRKRHRSGDSAVVRVHVMTTAKRQQEGSRK